ncbi:MAG: amidohydrolase [Deltaproteobacteria bacterium]|nr:amidohydrolase [Deltaproteobacteria bacterium]
MTQKLRAALLLCALACLGQGCRRSAPTSALAPLSSDELASCLDALADSAGEPDAVTRARGLLELAERERLTFAATGNIYQHTLYPTPDAGCLEAGTCFADYLAFQLAESQRRFTPAPVDANAARVQALARHLDRDTLARELLRRSKRAQRLLERTPVTWDGPAGAGVQELRLLVTGHASEPRRDAALARVRAEHPGRFRVARIQREQAAPAFALLGDRLTAAVIVGGKLVKDVVSEDQWRGLLLGDDHVAARADAAAAEPICDAHVHLAAGGEAQLLRALERNGIDRAVLAALPRGPDYAGWRESNQAVLALARAQPGRVLALVVLSPSEPEPLRQLEAYVAQGARGVKLMSGHDAYFQHDGGRDLDGPAMREVFRFCEQRGLPILWHVNTHLYAAGFLRVLRDFPALRVIDPHLGGYLSYAPELVRQLLRQYPNLFLDFSFGMQPMYLRRALEDLSLRHDDWRSLVLELPDRFMYGSDLVVAPSTSLSHSKLAHALYRDLFEAETYDLDLFAAPGYAQPYQPSHHRPRLRGLALPPAVLRQLYWDNAVRIYGTP